jgi:hypothetical protein
MSESDASRNREESGPDAPTQSASEPAELENSGEVDSGGWAAETNETTFITFRQDGTVSPNSVLVDRHFEDAEAVVVHTNDELEEDVLGIKPISDYDPDKETHLKLMEGDVFNPKTILQRNGIEHEETTRYKFPTWNTDHEMLVVNLSEDGETLDSTSDDS